jgi:hypothetical protein
MNAPWPDQLRALLELQKIDGRIFVLEREKAAKPAERSALQRQFESKQAGLKAAEQAQKDLQVKQKEKETELLTKESNVKKYQAQQMQVKTNKEYAALTHEIGVLKADCGLYEDEILRLMDQIEGQKKAIESERRLLGEEEKKHKAALAAIDARLAEIEAELGGLREGRSKFVPSVEKPLLSQYEKILKKREGVAVAALAGESCGGCNTRITPQTVEELRQGEKMLTCESCGRILYETGA